MENQSFPRFDIFDWRDDLDFLVSIIPIFAVVSPLWGYDFKFLHQLRLTE